MHNFICSFRVSTRISSSDGVEYTVPSLLEEEQQKQTMDKLEEQ